MGARYMCGTLDIGDTRFNDVPFVPSQDCLHWEFCQEDAYRKGREDQGELNTDTVREIHELVYQQGIEKGRAEKYKEIVSEYMLLTEKQVADIRADVIEEVFKGIYEHFEKHHIEVLGKDEVLDELILFLDEYYVYHKIKEKLKEQTNE